MAEKPKPPQMVVWDGHRFAFETREMSPKDWRVSGASDEDVAGMVVMEWSAANNWRISREDIPLNDVDLGGWMSRNGFRLVDA